MNVRRSAACAALALAFSSIPVTARAADRAGFSYDYTVYDARYDDLLTSIDAYKPFGSPASRLRPYAGLTLTRDSRSTPGAPTATGQPPIPLLFSDNYATAALGVQYTNPSGLRIFAQGGGSRTIGPVAAQPSGGDARGGVQYYRDYGTVLAPHRSYGNLYASTTYYSRYSDAVLYAQSERIANLAGRERPVEAYVRGVVTLDTRDHYYANLAELAVGLRWHPFGTTGLTFALEQIGGTYLRGALRPAGTGATYADFRPTVSLGFPL